MRLATRSIVDPTTARQQTVELWSNDASFLVLPDYHADDRRALAALLPLAALAGAVVAAIWRARPRR